MTSTKIFKDIVTSLIRNPKLLIRVLDEENAKKDYVLRKYGYLKGLPTISLLDLFPDFQETIEPYSFLEGTSMITDLALLKSLARKYAHCMYLEIGTWRGESIANVASIAESCISISLSADEMKDLGMPEDFIKTHWFFSKGLSNVTHIGHDSRSFDFSPLEKTMDLIFIDGDHSYETVMMDTQNAFKLLKNNNSIIVWHDYGFGPETVRWSVLAGILDGCTDDQRASLYHISNTMCAIYIKDQFNTMHITFPQIPDKKFKIILSGAKIPA